MGLFAAGQVVTLPFPHTDLSPGKLRPVLVLASAGRTDWIVCQITSNPTAEKAPIRLTQAEFENGSLPTPAMCARANSSLPMRGNLSKCWVR